MIVIAGPCVIESEKATLEIAHELKRQLKGLPIDFYFKASFDKANRTSVHGFRGPGLEGGLKVLSRVREETGLKLLTDFHSVEQAEPVAQVVDVMQIPAFLCRQTDLIAAGAQAASKHGRVLNVKKGQFLAPGDARNIVEKVRESGDGSKVWITERGTTFGYGNLVVDFAGMVTLRKLGVPIIFDATHSVQKPGQGADGRSTGGARECIETLGRCGMAAGASGVFLETHPNPEQAKSDGPNAFPLEHVGAWVTQLVKIHQLAVSMPEVLASPRY